MERVNSGETTDKVHHNVSGHLGFEDVDSRPSKTSGNKKSLKLSTLSKPSYRTDEDILLSDEEVKLLIVRDLNQEIVNSALDIIYENYLEKQTVYFVSHCSRLAWKALVEWQFQIKDKEGYREAVKDMYDTEPNPSPKDSWAGHSLPIAPEYSISPHSSHKESEARTTVPTLFSTISSSESKKSVSHVSTTAQAGRVTLSRSKFVYAPASRPKKSVDSPKLIIDSKINKADELKKESYELPFPVPLQAKHFPSARVEVEYAIMPGNPSKDVSMKNKLKTKTVFLKGPTEGHTSKIRKN